MSFLTALNQTTERFTDPFLHYIIHDPLTSEMLREISDVEMPDVPRIYDGTRAGNARSDTAKNANTRCFVTRENRGDFPALAQLIDELMQRETIEAVEDRLQRSMDGCYLRFELLCDRTGFWLAPHKDIPEKRMSMLIYANPFKESETLGTDLYDANKQLVKTMPYRDNIGYMFSPGDDTWHGLELKEIKKERRSLLINYVTFETCWKLPGRSKRSAA